MDWLNDFEYEHDLDDYSDIYTWVHNLNDKDLIDEVLKCSNKINKPYGTIDIKAMAKKIKTLYKSKCKGKQRETLQHALLVYKS